MPTMIDMTVFGDRRFMRDEVVLEFLKEEPGTGNRENTSKYIYTVEMITDGRQVQLYRPATLNKGFDFTVHVSDTEFWATVLVARRGHAVGKIRYSRTVTQPTHDSILEDLANKKKEDPVKYKRVADLIKEIYHCRPVSDTEMTAITFQSGHSVEVVLRVIKWLFIEQDVTFWNWSGREMFYSKLCEVGEVPTC